MQSKPAASISSESKRKRPIRSSFVQANFLFIVTLSVVAVPGMTTVRPSSIAVSGFGAEFVDVLVNQGGLLLDLAIAVSWQVPVLLALLAVEIAMAAHRALRRRPVSRLYAIALLTFMLAVLVGACVFGISASQIGSDTDLLKLPPAMGPLVGLLTGDAEALSASPQSEPVWLAAVLWHLPFIVAIVVIEGLFLWRYFSQGHKFSACFIVSIVWVLLIAWEVFSTDLKLTHPVLVPTPETVFMVFVKVWDEIVRNVQSSLLLLAQGFLTSLVAATVIGLFVGWLPKVREVVFPIAHALAPVPAIVFTPYLVYLLGSFKTAAIMVIFLGIFWPTLMNTILRVEELDRRIVDSAKMMGLSAPTMIFKVLLPYLYPTIITGLKVQLPSAMLMLVMAEMYGASSGLGYFVVNYTNYGNYTNVVAGIITVGVVVTFLDALVGALVRKTVRWSE